MNEAQNIEWKQTWRDEYLKWICAFANSEGGKLFIGKNDKGETVHLSKFQSLLEDIPAKIKNAMGIICPIKLREDDNNKYIEIVVNGYANPISYKGKYYVRSGSSTHELNGVALAEFLLLKSGKTWDEIVVEDASIEDIDSATIEKFITDSKDKGRLPNTDGLDTLQILEKLRLSYNFQIKRAGIVLFGKDPNRFFSNCKVMIGRFGKDSEELKFQEPIEGNLVYLLDEVQNILNYKFFTRPIDFEGMHRREADEYPVAAIREMLLNALVHKRYMGAAIQIRVFDDRFSIWNEGTLPNGMTVESLKTEHNSKSPNPVIADACFKAGYIDTWGRGTLKIFKACKDAGLPEPRIVEKDGGIEVTLFKENVSVKLRSNFGVTLEKVWESPKEISSILSSDYDVFIDFIALENNITSEKLRRDFGETSKEFRRKFGDKKALLLFLIALKPEISALEASEKIGVSDRTIESYFAQLKETILQRIGPDKGGYWKIIVI
jgi:ATP-dependent DNA helicase RecG